MNILFVLYGGLDTNTANPIGLFCEELTRLGHDCVICYPDLSSSAGIQKEINGIATCSFSFALKNPHKLFKDGRLADVLHACTPRESVRNFVGAYMHNHPTALVVYLEDNEYWISQHHLNLDDCQLLGLSNKELFDGIPQGMSNPYIYKQFIGLADVVLLIQDKLKIEVPDWIPSIVIPWGVDLNFFYPSNGKESVRQNLGLDSDTFTLVYHGGLNGFTAPAMRDLCEAVILINQRGVKCKLVRTGVMPLNFLHELDPSVADCVLDLGIVDRVRLPEILAVADLYVQPGRINPFEDLRLPSKVPEFLAMGKPVILPDVNIANLFRDGVDAVLLKDGSPSEIAQRCIELFLSKSRMKELGLHARKFAELHFDIKKQTRELENAYKKARSIFNQNITKEIWQEVERRGIDSGFVLRALVMNGCDSEDDKLHLDEVCELVGEQTARIGVLGGRLDLLKQSMSQQDSLLIQKEQQLAACDQNLKIVDQLLASKDQLLASKDQLLTLKDQQLVARGEDLNARDQLLTLKDQQLAARDIQIEGLISGINEMRGSFSWRISSPVRVVGSFLRKMIKALNLARYLIKTNGGLLKFLLKLAKITVKEGPRGLYSRLVRIKKVSTNFSSQLYEKIPTPLLPARTQRYEIKRAGLDSKAINYYGYIRAESGLGMASRGYISILRSLGYKVTAINLPCGLSEVDFDVDESPNDDALFNLIHMNADSMHYFFTKISDSHIKGKINIGLWVTELSAFRGDWFDSFSPLHEIWVPSDFCNQAVSSLSPIPVHTIPYVVQAQDIDADRLTRSYYELPDKGYIFAFMFDCSSFIARKNPFALVRAFRELNQKYSDIYLALKLSNAHKDPATFELLMKEIGDNKNVIIIERSFSEIELSGFYKNIDCYVSPHRSEGFGLTMAEAMLAELPVIATDYSGSKDFVIAEHAYPVRSKLKVIEQNYGPYFKGLIWGDPDPRDLLFQMSEAYLNGNESRLKGALAKKVILEKFSVLAIGKLINTALQNWALNER